LPAADATPPKKKSNRRNGRSKKTVRSDTGERTMATPRDRDGTMWRVKWADIVTWLAHPPAIRKAIYTTNAFESIHSVIRKSTRNRTIYPDEDSALKLIWRAIREASGQGMMPVRHRKEAWTHGAIMFEAHCPNPPASNVPCSANRRIRTLPPVLQSDSGPTP